MAFAKEGRKYNMKNEEITLQTKRDFARALKKMLRKQPLNKITVKQLLTLTNRSRPTFYYHFEDIPDLVKWTVQDEIISFMKESNGYNHWDEDIYNIFSYLYNNQSFVHAFYDHLNIKQFHEIFRELQINLLLRYIDEIIKKENLHVKVDDRRFIAQIFSGGFTEIVLDWLEHGQKETPEQIKKEFCRTQEDTIVHSLRNAAKNRNLFPN